MSLKKIKVMNTAFRDGFQSVYGARVFLEDYLPAIEAAKDAGIRHFETGGGASFQSSYFYCNQDAFKNMDRIRATVGSDINLQTLARGINVVGLESQSKDIINLHAKLFKKHGITTIRNFDALNDVNNLIYSGQCIVDAGLKHEVTVTMMALPPGCEGAHTVDFYEDVLRRILDAGIPYDSVCFKDASGTSTPRKVFDVIKMAKTVLPADIPVRFHTHDTAGMGVISYKAAINAGVDGIDLAMAPVSGGTCQPDIITMWHALRGSEYELDLDINKVIKAEEVFKDCMKEYFMPPEAKAIEPLIPFSPMPGGALTANTQMMRDNGILDKFPEVIAEMSEVVKRGGFGTSVTPVSQFYFQQAFNNVMFGRWKKIADGYGKMVLGYFGQTPVEPDKEIMQLAKEQLKLEKTDKSPLELNDVDPKKGIAAARKILLNEGMVENEENIFIIATCKDKGLDFLKGRGKIGVRKSKPQTSDSEGYTVKLNGRTYSVVLKNGNQAIVNGKKFNFDLKDGVEKSVPTDINEASSSDARPVRSPLPGSVVRVKMKTGDVVNAGDTVLVIEAMKMETEIKASISGTLTSIAVGAGDQVTAGQTLAWIN